MTAVVSVRVQKRETPNTTTPAANDAEYTPSSKRPNFTLTPEHIERQKAWAELHLRKNFADEHHWAALAADFGIRLPAWYVPGAEIWVLRGCLRKTGVSIRVIEEILGCSLRENAELNPDWPAYALLGTILEDLTELAPAKR